MSAQTDECDDGGIYEDEAGQPAGQRNHSQSRRFLDRSMDEIWTPFGFHATPMTAEE